MLRMIDLSAGGTSNSLSAARPKVDFIEVDSRAETRYSARPAMLEPMLWAH